MTPLGGFHAFAVLASILLSSLDVRCVSIVKRDLGDSTKIQLNASSQHLGTPPAAGSVEAHAALPAPLGASAAPSGDQQPLTTLIDHAVVRLDQGADTPTTTLYVASMQQDFHLPSVKPKLSADNPLQTSTITTAASLRPDIEVNVPRATVGKAPLPIPTTNEPVLSKSLEGPLFTKAADNVFENSSLAQFNTEEMLTTNPRTNIVSTGTENSTSPALFDGHSENTEQATVVSSIVSPAPLTTASRPSPEQSLDGSVYLSPAEKGVSRTEATQTSSMSPASEVSEDWDDTKLIAKNHRQFSVHENLTASTDPDSRNTGPLFANLTDTTTEKTEEKNYTGTEERPLATVAKGDILPDATDSSPHVSEAAFVDGAGVTLSATNISVEIAISTPSTDTITKMEANVYKAELVSVVSEPPHLDDTKTQTASESMPTHASYTSSERTLLAPPAKLESEEGEEERDGEEEEDEDTEDDDDEEEDEEDKDLDSVDDSVEGDTELPAFTLPDLSSQEPLLSKKDQPALEEVPFRVPDTLEWEQQNQGLVRSWMEKLKGKAGYMSGMLLPVGIGIAGAFSILGALYSIKFMNRRRRLGFKRHKRKQREFNSMQDRVMLLADSSEDEF